MPMKPGPATARGRVDIEALRDALVPVTVLFVSLPVAIFLAGWLKGSLTLPLVLLLGLACVRYCSSSSRPRGTDPLSLPLGRLVIALAPGILLAVLSGAGGWGAQDGDWLKHNAILMDLIREPWPTSYQIDGQRYLLVYYVAYYLPAAIVGRLGGWVMANYVLFLTTLIGVVLVTLWLVVLSRGALMLTGVLFVLFSGMDCLGKVARNLAAGSAPLLGHWLHIESWAHIWQYSSNVTLIFFVPQHALGGWLLTCLALDAFRREEIAARWVFLLGLSLLWTPFVTLGLMPLIAVMLVYGSGSVRREVRESFSTINIVGLLTAVVLATYLAARFEPYSLPSEYVRTITRPDGLIPLVEHHGAADFARFVKRLLLFYFAEFLLLSILLLRFARTSGAGPQAATLVKAATVTLLLLPFFRYGQNNDLVMRASIPSLLVILVVSLRVLPGWRARPWIAAVVALVLMLGSVTPAVEIRRHAKWIAAAGSLVRIPAEGEVANLFALQRGIHNSYNFVAQYLGAGDSLFSRHLARQAARTAGNY